MARYTDSIETKPEQIAAFAASLRTIAASFEQQAEFMQTNGIESLPVPKWQTAKTSLNGLASFAAGIQQAVVEARVLDTVNGMLNKEQTKLKPKGKRGNNPG